MPVVGCRFIVHRKESLRIHRPVILLASVLAGIGPQVRTYQYWKRVPLDRKIIRTIEQDGSRGGVHKEKSSRMG